MQAEAANQEHEPSNRGLDRRVDLTAIPVEALAWIAVVLLAIGSSLIGRTNWPLSAGESAIARDAWALVTGNDMSAAADSHPSIVQLTAFMFFLFGDTDYTARLVPLAAGIAVLAALFWLRSWFGRVPALSIAIVWALSPVMSLSLVRLDAGVLLVLAILLTFTLTISMPMDPHRTRAIVLGVALALGLTSNPLSWILLPLTMLAAMVLIRDFRLGGSILTALLSFLATFVIITTWFATRLSGPADFIVESLQVLWSTNLSEFGTAWQALIVVLIADEPLLLLLSLIGLAILVVKPAWELTAHPALFISFAAWAVPTLSLGILLSGAGHGLYAPTTFPLVILGGLGLSMLLDGLRALKDPGRAWLWAGILLALSVAIIRFADSFAQGPEGDIASWLVNVLVLALLILVPLGYVIIRLSAGSGWTYVPVAMMVIVVVVSGIGLRTSLLLADTSQDRPGEILRAGNTSPALGLLEHRIRTYSRDATTYIQDVRDPAGGRGLMIVIHHEIADPVGWYFRHFPNLAIVRDPEDVPPETAPDVAFIPAEEETAWEDSFTQHRSRDYPLRYENADQISASSMNAILLSMINPGEYRNLLEFSIRQERPELLEHESMIVLLREDHADVLWGTGASD